MLSRFRRACPSAPPTATVHRPGSPQHRAHPGRAVRCGPDRRAHRDAHAAALKFDADVSLWLRCRQLKRDELRGRRRQRPDRCSGRFRLLGTVDPTAKHVGIEPVGLRDRRARYARLLAGPDEFGLELGAVLAPAAPAAWLQNRSVHVSTKKLSGVEPPMKPTRDKDDFAGRIRFLLALAQTVAVRKNERKTKRMRI